MSEVLQDFFICKVSKTPLDPDEAIGNEWIWPPCAHTDILNRTNAWFSVQREEVDELAGRVVSEQNSTVLGEPPQFLASPRRHATQPFPSYFLPQGGISDEGRLRDGKGSPLNGQGSESEVILRP
ncbi:hypothetical protein VDBG_06128 [Verticillium alfalfae VaMs.102]|uniref:Uncharacterized protein n=1 Tax=Verticillium alfalfae (strain VaMs.102 / ATCC MYA-4576 / FGSC 10136) TaxID=526221 RepID=C9SMK4_VERA1|nr:hypothetical protein VDBG_06128 [Verticillium alfalfae VaMs.102]EEY20019.1 hypothetical protein VDBG_06128 [Verticillium alfalfae VaMs.102]